MNFSLKFLIVESEKTMLFYCSDAPIDSVSYIYWKEQGIEQKFRVKAPFSMTIRPKLIPKLKPAPDCLAIQRIGFTYWSEAFTPRAIDPYVDPRSLSRLTFIRESSVNALPYLAFPLEPEWFYMPIDPGNSQVIIGYVQGSPIFSAYRRNPGIRVASTNREFPSTSRLCGSISVQLAFQAFGTIFTFDDSSKGYGNTLYQGEIVGGITSVVDFAGNEYVESVEEICDMQIFNTAGALIFSRRIEDCSTVQIQCGGECPPGTCKCWISKAAKSFCCAKCRGK